MNENTFDKLNDLPPDKQLFYLKAKELELKEIELKQKKDNSDKQWWQNPLYITVFGLFANIIVNYFNSCNEQKIERDKVNSTAILEAIKTGDTASAKRNLQFLLSIGFLNDEDGRVKKYLDSATNIPVLPASISNFSDQSIPYSRVDTIQENSPLYKLSACVGVLKFYNGNEVESFNTGVIFNKNTVILPIALRRGISERNRITFTLNYNNSKNTGEEIELLDASKSFNNNNDFYFFTPKSKFVFTENISKYEKVAPKSGQQILIIQHPSGREKAVASSENFKILNIDAKKNKFTYNCKTEPGSGGALIITNDFKIVGLHLGRNQDGSKYGIAFKY